MEKKPFRLCDNTSHHGTSFDVKKVKLTEDFDNDVAYWCLECRCRDIEMIKE